MARYRIGRLVEDTSHATARYTEASGRNWLSSTRESHSNHQELYRSPCGRYYMLHTAQWQGTKPHAEWLTPREAARWLITMQITLPDDLQGYQEAE